MSNAPHVQKIVYNQDATAVRSSPEKLTNISSQTMDQWKKVAAASGATAKRPRP